MTCESDFAAWVSRVGEAADREPRLIELLQEDHPQYRERSGSAIARMRGWVLLRLSDQPLPDSALVYALEELDNGRSAYLVGVAARVLRTSSQPSEQFAAYLVDAIANVRERDEYLDLEVYGGIGVPETGSTAFSEVLTTLRWLGVHARGTLPALEAMLAPRDYSLDEEQRREVGLTVDAVRGAFEPGPPPGCCNPAWRMFRGWSHRAARNPDLIEFEDQDGERVRFNEFFSGRPSIVVFFYTRCDNALKCSLTVSKLAQVQRLLDRAGAGERIGTAAITYDPGYDFPQRLRGYAASRGVRMDSKNRVLRAVAGVEALRDHFRLGVNFIGSIVNRHRIEAFLVDGKGRVVASFDRLRWDERELVAKALELLVVESPAEPRILPRSLLPRALSPSISVVIALFPKCPICGATYLSLSGMAALPTLPSVYWLFPVLVLLSIANLASLWWLARSTGGWFGFALALAGAVVALAGGVALDQAAGLWAGVVLSTAGSAVGVAGSRRLAGEVAPASARA